MSNLGDTLCHYAKGDVMQSHAGQGIAWIAHVLMTKSLAGLFTLQEVCAASPHFEVFWRITTDLITYLNHT